MQAAEAMPAMGAGSNDKATIRLNGITLAVQLLLVLALFRQGRAFVELAAFTRLLRSKIAAQSQ